MCHSLDSGIQSNKGRSLSKCNKSIRPRLQGYLAHKKQPPPRTLQKAYAWGPMVVLGGAGCFLSARYPYKGSSREAQRAWAADRLGTIQPSFARAAPPTSQNLAGPEWDGCLDI